MQVAAEVRPEKAAAQAASQLLSSKAAFETLKKDHEYQSALQCRMQVSGEVRPEEVVRPLPKTLAMSATRVIMHQIVLPSEVDFMGICFGGQVPPPHFPLSS